MSGLDRPAKFRKIMTGDAERFDKAFPKFVKDLMEESDFQDLEIGEAVTRLKEVCRKYCHLWLKSEANMLLFTLAVFLKFISMRKLKN